jgi:hypothetical protein
MRDELAARRAARARRRLYRRLPHIWVAQLGRVLAVLHQFTRPRA